MVSLYTYLFWLYCISLFCLIGVPDMSPASIDVSTINILSSVLEDDLQRSSDGKFIYIPVLALLYFHYFV